MATTKQASNSTAKTDAEKEAEKARLKAEEEKAKAEAKKKADEEVKKEEEHLTKPEIMKRTLAKQDKKEVFIPLEGKEPEGAVETVILNGYRFDIKKGVRVEVPAQVAEVIYDAMEQTQKAHKEALAKADKAESL